MDIERRIAEVLKHGQFVNGPEVSTLEKALAAYVGVSHAVACNSGTDALVLALRALGIGFGDYVAVPAFTFSATAAAVELTGARIVFCDIREEDFNIDPKEAQRAIEHGVHAVIGVNMFGIPADFPAIRKMAAKTNCKVIEDAAQSMGASLDGRRSGSLADVGCTSFYPSKPLSCAGDGGMVFAEDKYVAKNIRAMANHGRSNGNRYEAECVGCNSRLDTIQAAVLLERFEYFESHELPTRNRRAKLYFDKLGTATISAVQGNLELAWSWYPVLYDTRKERDDALAEYGQSGARVIYPIPLHLMPAFDHYGMDRGSFPVAESVCDRVLAFPINHHWETCKCLSTISSANRAITDLK